MNVQEVHMRLVQNAVVRLIILCVILLPNGKNGLITHYMVTSKLWGRCYLSQNAF